MTEASTEAAADDVRFIDVRGHHLRIRVRRGTSPGPPLLLCSGLGTAFEAFQPFVDALDRTTEVIRFDVPGVGGSPPSLVSSCFPAAAQVAAHLVRALGYTRVDVLGISWGGGLAQQVACQSRRLVRRLVLVSTGPGSLMVPGRPRVLAKLLTPRRFVDRGYALSVVGDLYGGTARTAPERVVQILAEGGRLPSRAGYLCQLVASAGWTGLPRLGLIRQPTLILAGDDDPLVPLVNARILHSLIPRSRLRVYFGGHVALVTEADILAPVISDFLAGPD